MEVVSLTPNAIEQAKELLDREREKKPEAEAAGLRISVLGGGCSGLQYSLNFSEARESDEVHQYPNGLIVMVDPKSAEFLRGSTLEFHNSIEQTGFEVQNPNAVGSCGCGKSFCT